MYQEYGRVISVMYPDDHLQDGLDISLVHKKTRQLKRQLLKLLEMAVYSSGEMGMRSVSIDGNQQ